jgi:glycosyltransferase involved in cell wall biosynthesis
MLVDGANGFAVEPDAGAFAARVERLLGEPTLLAKMRARSGETALNFSVQAQAQQLFNLYGCVIEQKKSGRCAAVETLRSAAFLAKRSETPGPLR